MLKEIWLEMFIDFKPVESVTVIDANGINDVERSTANDGDTAPGASDHAARGRK